MPSTKTLNQSPTISATENADLLWIWDSSASELNKISRTNLLTTTDDFNTSYARLNGRSGGQTLIGGTAANDDLKLEGTSSATRTTSYVVLQPNGGNVGIGTTSPTSILSVTDGAAPYAASTGVVIDTKRAVINGTDDARVGLRLSNNSNAFFIFYGGTSDRLRFMDGASNEVMSLLSGGNVGIGTTSPSTRLDIDAGAIEFAEMTAPAAGAVNTGRLFCRDNGSGKTQLCIIFSGGGAIQVIATQP